jgi:MFS family permease
MRREAAAGQVQRWYLLAVLIVAYTFAFVDRQILSLLVEPLKRDLHLSDTQIGLLQGLAFAVFVALAGVPIGRLVDMARRPGVIAAGMALWSLMTAACGLAGSYPALFAARAGVSVGEAALTPAAHAIIADSFPPKRLGLALGLLSVGAYIGIGVSLILAGVILGHLPADGVVLRGLGRIPAWRIVFVAFGAPGLLVAVWVATLPDPKRERGRPRQADVKDVVGFFRTHGWALILLNLMAAFASMSSYAVGAWTPSFLIRTYGWTASQAGLAYGLTTIVCGIGGVLGGGALSDWALRRGPSAGRLLIMALASLCAAPLAALAPLASHATTSLGLTAATALLATACTSITAAAQQAITPSGMRGLVSSTGVLMVNLIGLGLGPTLVGLATDLLFHDPMKLRYALALLTPIMLLTSAGIGLASLGVYNKAARSSYGRPTEAPP